MQIGLSDRKITDSFKEGNMLHIHDKTSVCLKEISDYKLAFLREAATLSVTHD